MAHGVYCMEHSFVMWIAYLASTGFANFYPASAVTTSGALTLAPMRVSLLSDHLYTHTIHTYPDFANAFEHGIRGLSTLKSILTEQCMQNDCPCCY